jgi:hypothetical protein
LKKHKLIHTRQKGDSTQESVSPSPQWHHMSWQQVWGRLSWETSLLFVDSFFCFKVCFFFKHENVVLIKWFSHEVTWIRLVMLTHSLPADVLGCRGKSNM